MRAVAVTLLFSFLLLGCNRGEEAAPTIPSADDVVPATTTPATTSTTEPRLTLEEASLQFTACMRDQGIDLPDLRLDAEGRPLLGEAFDDVDLASDEFRTALTACSDILTRAGALDLSTDPELQAALIDQLVTFSECMRTEGVEDFPDPSPGFTGTGSPYPLGLVPFDDPDFESAVSTCQDRLGSIGLGE